MRSVRGLLRLRYGQIGPLIYEWWVIYILATHNPSLTIIKLKWIGQSQIFLLHTTKEAKRDILHTTHNPPISKQFLYCKICHQVDHLQDECKEAKFALTVQTTALWAILAVFGSDIISKVVFIILHNPLV